ncbi:MAG TPA: TetR/AcrR family transcriptional regulator [Candidatus Cybelea sp.]
MGRVRRRDAEGSRNAILDAAEAGFAERGYDGTTFSEICAQARVSRGLPSYLFGSKEELYREVVGRAAGSLRKTVLDPLCRTVAKASLDEALELAVASYLRYLAGHRRIVRLLQWEMLAAGGAVRPYAPSTELFDEMLRILQPAFRRHGYSNDDAKNALASIVSLCFFPFTSRFAARLTGLGNAHAADVAKLQKTILRLLRKGLLS